MQLGHFCVLKTSPPARIIVLRYVELVISHGAAVTSLDKSLFVSGSAVTIIPHPLCGPPGAMVTCSPVNMMRVHSSKLYVKHEGEAREHFPFHGRPGQARAGVPTGSWGCTGLQEESGAIMRLSDWSLQAPSIPLCQRFVHNYDRFCAAIEL